MIVGIGVDSVEIDRFKDWHSFAQKQLLKVFSEKEVLFCLSHPSKSAERLAVRFAAREAFFKALIQATNEPVPFFTVCKSITVERNELGTPRLDINWQMLSSYTPIAEQGLKPLLSLTHSHVVATAFVILTK